MMDFQIYDKIKEEDDFDEEEETIFPGTSGTVPCLVCGRMTNTGHHYGVQSCLGCKTFFRRIIMKGSTPSCKFGGNCKLVKGAHAKRICRSCRLKRCREIGMTEKALHPCRDAIGKRSRTLPSRSASPSEDSSTSPGSSSGTQPALSPDFEKISQMKERAANALAFLHQVREDDIRLRASLSLAHNHAPATDPEQFYAIPPIEVLLTKLSLNASVGHALKADLALIREWVYRLEPLAALSQDSKRGLIAQFSLKHTILEHGLLTQRIPFIENVWFYGDLSCYLTNFDSIPEPIRALVTPSIQAHHGLLMPLFRWLREEIVSSLDRHKFSTLEVAAIKLICLLSKDGIVLHDDERQIVQRLRDDVLVGLHEYYVAQGIVDIEQRFGELLIFCGTLRFIVRLQQASFRGRVQLRMLQFFDRGGFDPESYDQLFPDE